MDVTTIKGIGQQYKKKLNKARVMDVADLRSMDIKDMSKKTGISAERLKEWQQYACDMKLLTDVQGIGPTYSKRLHKQGITTPEELAAADICATAKNIQVSEKRLTKWVEIAQKMVETAQPKAKKAVVAEPIGPDNASIHIKGDEALVTIKGTIHESVPVFHGDGMEAIAQDQKIAVHIDSTDTTHLWFNDTWHTNVPMKKEGFLDKIKRMLGI